MKEALSETRRLSEWRRMTFMKPATNIFPPDAPSACLYPLLFFRAPFFFSLLFSFDKSFTLVYFQIYYRNTYHVALQKYSLYTSKNNAEGINATIIFGIMWIIIRNRPNTKKIWIIKDGECATEVKYSTSIYICSKQHFFIVVAF